LNISISYAIILSRVSLIYHINEKILGDENMEIKEVAGFCTTTKKLKIYTKKMYEILLTQELFNEAILKYYDLILDNEEVLNLSNMYALRELEKMTIKSRDGKKPQYDLELDLPMYLRRSAINQAIGAARTYTLKLKNNLNSSRAKQFNNSLVLYKGMYKDLTQNTIQIKLWNGTSWEWCKANIKGESLNLEEEILSPSIVIHKDFAMLHIPIRYKVKDVKPVKARMQDEDVRVMRN
jgi:hypothetical protein